jgi:SARP family transcriptional regulator, regulator of embCAB operon
MNEARAVSNESLIAELWGEDPPAHGPNALQAHVSRLRRVLAKLDQSGEVRLRGVSSGYLLELGDRSSLDAHRFSRILSAIQQEPNLSPAEMNRKLLSALDIWRGPIFGGPLGGPICQAAATRLEEARAAALDLYFDNELKLGNHAKVIPELYELAESNSFNERLCEQLMVALYRAGRQTDALSTYQEMRRRMNEDLGVEPSPTLRMFEQAVLEHDPALRIGADHSAIKNRNQPARRAAVFVGMR